MTIEEFKRMLVLVISQGLPGGYFQSIFSGEESDKLLGKVKSGDVGVKSFNGRSGEVVPQTGDYTAEMVGAAPGGFGGFGERLEYLNTESDSDGTKFNQMLEDMYSRMEDGTAKQIAWTDYPYFDWTMYGGILYKYSSDYGVLVGNSYGAQGKLVMKAKERGAWQEFNWINPPLSPGNEYCTTERYNGKPVYVRLVNMGKASSTSGNNISTTYTGTCIGYSVVWSVGGEVDAGPILVSLGKLAAYCFAQNGVFYVKTVSADAGLYDVSVVIKTVKEG